MAALTYQSQLMAATAANASQQMDQYVQMLVQHQEQLKQTQHQIMEQLATLTLNHGEGGRNRDVPIHLHPPPLHPTNLDATILDTVVGKAAVADGAEAVDYPLSRPAIQPPPCLSLQVGHTHF
jgi:hypothetical protein